MSLRIRDHASGQERKQPRCVVNEKHEVGEIQLEPMRQKRTRGPLSDRRGLTYDLSEKDSLVTASSSFHSDF